MVQECKPGDGPGGCVPGRGNIKNKNTKLPCFVQVHLDLSHFKCPIVTVATQVDSVLADYKIIHRFGNTV